MQFLASATIAAAGGGNELTDPDADRAKFDAGLTAEPKEIDPEQRVLMDALGVGRGHYR